MLAEKLPAAKAAEWGLIWQVVDDAEFAGVIDALAAQIAQMPTKALVRTRELMHAATGHTLEQQLSMEVGFICEMGWSADYREGLRAFEEKRAPNFTGE
jgi:2-(1,2-epoxy-1,2-dihydrophenyl)acetyl-CoA isomerase